MAEVAVASGLLRRLEAAASASVNAGRPAAALHVLRFDTLRSLSYAAVLLQPDLVDGAPAYRLLLIDALRLAARASAAANSRGAGQDYLAASVRLSRVAVACRGLRAVDETARGLVAPQLEAQFDDADDAGEQRSLAALVRESGETPVRGWAADAPTQHALASLFDRAKQLHPNLSLDDFAAAQEASIAAFHKALAASQSNNGGL